MREDKDFIVALVPIIQKLLENVPLEVCQYDRETIMGKLPSHRSQDCLD